MKKAPAKAMKTYEGSKADKKADMKGTKKPMPKKK